MTNSAHAQELQTLQTKDFDFVFVEETVLSRYKSQSLSIDSSAPAAFNQDSLQKFHDEFKCLVLASNQATIEQEELAYDDITLKAPIEPHEIEWLDWRVSKAATKSETATKEATKQAVRTLQGLPTGTLPPIDTWVVQVIVALICLNLLFAGLIVSETRLANWMNWLHL